MTFVFLSLKFFNMAKVFIFLIVSVIIVANFLAMVKDTIDPNDAAGDTLSQYRAFRDERSWPRIDDRPDNIFWIIQLSDLHISKFRDLQRGPDFINFCKDYLTVIQPHVILITGDLTDAKDMDDRSRQFSEEWQVYQQAVWECKSVVNATFLDTRGNHDAFDVPDIYGEGNLYSHMLVPEICRHLSDYLTIGYHRNHHEKHSAQGPSHELSYHYQHVTKFGKYSFIAVDACPIPGPKRPFNFFGNLDDEREKLLEHFSLESRSSNLTVWFGHYPTSLILQDPPGIRHVMRNGVAYLCGHLHTLGGLMPQMYSRQKTGTLELELGDWKENRIFRILAVDHDILSFTDERLGEWPVVLVTNPKHSLFLTPGREPVETIAYSTHIRVLVFSPKPIVSVEIFLDSVFAGKAVSKGGPLYTFPWNPHSFGSGLHMLRVKVKDNRNHIKTVQQPFSVDGSQPDFAFWPRFILMVNIFNLAKVAYGVLVFVYVLVLASLRQCGRVHNLFLPGDNFFVSFINGWTYRLWLVVKTDNIYYVLQGFIMYITFGPWFVGEIMSDYIGVVCVWGIYVKGAFLPGSLTFFYGIFQVLTFNIPLLLLLSLTLDIRRQQVSSLHVPATAQSLAGRYFIFSLFPFSILLVFQAYMALTEFPNNYGTLAMVLSPVRAGSLVVAVMLLYFAHTTTIKRTCAVNGRMF